MALSFRGATHSASIRGDPRNGMKAPVGSPVRLAVVDPSPGFRRGVATWAADSQSFHVTLEVGSIDEFLDEHPAVDVAIIGLEGSHSSPTLVEKVLNLTTTPVIFVVEGLDPSGAIALLRVGARGVISRSCEEADFAAAVAEVGAGGVHVANVSTDDLVKVLAMGDGRGGLTVRETEVLRLVAMGCSDKQIATELHIAISTVRTHLDRVRSKCGARNRADLTRTAYEIGVLPWGGDGQDTPAGPRTPLTVRPPRTDRRVPSQD